MSSSDCPSRPSAATAAAAVGRKGTEAPASGASGSSSTLACWPKPSATQEPSVGTPPPPPRCREYSRTSTVGLKVTCATLRRFAVGGSAATADEGRKQLRSAHPRAGWACCSPAGLPSEVAAAGCAFWFELGRRSTGRSFF
eukprot:CAMPEP_0179167704 /NCGR_PEP_ID=MMETSP0796-20121207/82468_1 /TAXON_ID=73915 /ORGANISM="Pyrodinium bahamense, Strain pbaha01" /LENGTH=140 /DNA_ID=CAMNT_0020870425 /DNA_START=229 /DNA_END=648 /DNA_ORIENTATION=+